VKTKAHKRGYFDVIIDGAGGAGFARLTDVAAPGGRICIYGGTTGAINELVPAKLFFKQLVIFGSTMGTEEEFEAMTLFVEQQQLVPVLDQVLPLSEAEAALRRMDSGQQFGKIVLTMEE
jgi:zinc-binding alcohol dehydrogenase/oxidoreductase